MRSYSQFGVGAVWALMVPLMLSGCGDDANGGGTPDADVVTDGGRVDAPVMMDGGGTPDSGSGVTLREDPVSALVAARTAVNMQLCTCNYEEFEFSSVAECVDYSVYLEENNPEGDAVGCDDTAAESVTSVHEEFSCRVEAHEAYAGCLAEAACDMAAMMACEFAVDAQLDACPDESSDADNDTYVDALVACVSGEANPACPEAMSGETGAEVFTANTFGAGNDFTGSCGGDYAPDVTFEWTAPAAGRFVIETFASRYDTSLYVLDGGCGGDMELGCNDDVVETDALWDYVPGYQAGLVVELTMGQTILVVLDGYDGAAGAGVVAIYPESELAGSGD